MAEIRLSKLIKQFNIGLDTLVDYLNSFGANIDKSNVSPNSKVSDTYLPALFERFGKDLELKRAAEKVNIKASAILEKVVGTIPVIKQPVLSASVAPEDFDWDAFENDGVENGTREDTLANYEQQLTKVTENEIVEGIVTSINKREVVVNVGAKKEGVISAPEFRYNPDLKVGDKVEVLVESVEDRKGMLVISHKKARQLKSWDMVNAAYESGEVVTGYVKTRTKGGFIVDVFGIEAFCPGSQMDLKYIRDYDVYVDKTLDFVVVKINQEFRNVVISRKAVLEKAKAAEGSKAPHPKHSSFQDKATPHIDHSSIFNSKALAIFEKKKPI